MSSGRHPAPRPLAAATGFTLIELVLVLVILAVAGVLAVPALQPALESTRTEAAARRMASWLDDARRRAVLERAAVIVQCRREQGRLEFAAAPAGSAPFRLPDGMEIVSCAPERLRYLPQGAASGMTLVLRDRSGRDRRLTVGAFTGLARVELPL